MKKLLFILALLCASVKAAPLPEQNIANMVAQNEVVMNAGLCAVANGPKPDPSEITFVGRKKISAYAQWYIASANYTKSSTGRYVMSQRIEEACRADADSDGCTYARARWSQAPLDVHTPGDLK